MLQQMRDKAQNLKFILWAVIFSFLISFVVIFQGGIGRATLSGGRPTDAASVGGRHISENEFRQALIRQEELYRQILGAQYDADRFLNPKAVLDQLIDRAILLEEADRIGVKASRSEIAEYVKEIQIFQDEAGRFDPAKYKDYLERSGKRAGQFERDLADDLRLNAMTRLLEAGASVPTAAVKDAWKRENETVSAEYVTFGFASHIAAVSVSDDEAKAWYDAHQSDYDAGAGRQIRWIRFSRDEYQKTLEKEADMRAYYEENVGAIYTMTEDQRRASVIVVAVAPGSSDAVKAAARAKAEGAAARAKAGEDFAGLARELSDDAATKDKGGDLGPFYQGFQEGPVDTAVFAAAEGDVVGPIETQRGFEVLKVTKGSGTKARSFEDVKDLVARGLYAKAAGEAQAAAVKSFQDALSKDGDFEKAAKAAGLTPSETAWITRTGDIPGLGPNPLVSSRAFELEPKSVSDPIADVGAQIVIQVLDQREKSPRTFEEARADVISAVQEKKARELARQDAEAFRAQAAAAPSLAAAGGDHAVQTATAVHRGGSVPGLGRAPDFLAAAFETPVGQVGRVADIPEGAAVLRVTERTEFDEAKFEADRDALEKRLRDQKAASLRTAALARLREEYSGKIRENAEIIAAYTPQQKQGS